MEFEGSLLFSQEPATVCALIQTASHKHCNKIFPAKYHSKSAITHLSELAVSVLRYSLPTERCPRVTEGDKQ
jgi:hypothetical protein